MKPTPGSDYNEKYDKNTNTIRAGSPLTSCLVTTIPTNEHTLYATLGLWLARSFYERSEH